MLAGGLSLAFDEKVIICDVSVFFDVNDLHQKVSIVVYGAHHSHHYLNYVLQKTHVLNSNGKNFKN